jgi:hypothetical protein
VIWSVAVVLPPAFVAVTVYEACAVAAVGVPDIVPATGSKLKPAGSAGLTPYEFTVPATVGVSDVIALPIVAEIVVTG